MSRTGYAVALLLLFCTACAPDPEPRAQIPLPATTPELGAAALFRFAVEMDPDSTLPDGLIRPDLQEEHGTALLDQLEPLAGAGAARILAIEQFPDTDRAAVDVEFDLPGEGFALWSVQLEQGADSAWYLVWAQGPDGSWPPRKKGRGEGLTSSPTEGLR